MTYSTLQCAMDSAGAAVCRPARCNPETELRLNATVAYDELASLDEHAEMVKLILVEASLLVEKYRNVRRHDVPHIAEISGLLDVLWQEIEMKRYAPTGLLDAAPLRTDHGCT